jgi:hypothetical protein
MFTHRATGNAAINETINPITAIRGFELVEIRLHLSAAGGAGNLTITLDANAGAAYDAVLLTQDMTLITDLVWQPENPIPFDNGDKLIVAWDNANGRTYGLETKFEGR